jgi:hypothetical protein
MKFSEAWLREWVNPDITTEQLADQLSMAGLEVDSVEPAAPAFTGVVVGEVLAREQHPDADKLSVCQRRYRHGRSITDRLRGEKRCGGYEGSGSDGGRHAAGRLQDQEGQAARRPIARHDLLGHRSWGWQSPRTASCRCRSMRPSGEISVTTWLSMISASMST